MFPNSVPKLLTEITSGDFWCWSAIEIIGATWRAFTAENSYSAHQFKSDVGSIPISFIRKKPTKAAFRQICQARAFAQLNMRIPSAKLNFIRDGQHFLLASFHGPTPVPINAGSI